VIEETVLSELRTLGTQLTEEIRSQTRRMLQEIRSRTRCLQQELKREVAAQSSPPRSPHSRTHPMSMSCSTASASFRLSGDSLVHSDVSMLKAVEKRSKKQAKDIRRGHTQDLQAENMEQVTQNWSSMSIPGELPPAVFDMPDPPEPPVIDSEKDSAEATRPEFRGHWENRGDAAAGCTKRFPPVRFEEQPDTLSESSISELSAGWLDPAAEHSGPPPRRKLSLTVDTARRRSLHKQFTAGGKPWAHMTASDVMRSSRFDNLIGGLIMLNAITIGVQTNYAAEHVTEEFPQLFILLERFFLIAFSMELCLRLYVLRRNFFYDGKGCDVWSSTLAWNYFDLMLVVAQYVEEIVTAMAASSGLNSSKIKLVRMLRILRIVRVLRVVRVLHLISELRTIVSSIVGSFKSLGWTVCLLLLMIYIVGVYFTQNVADHFVEVQPAGDFGEDDQLLKYYFGSLMRTILSLWQAMSGGADWDSMAWPLIVRVSPLTGILFAGYIAFALLALMNVVTGVFVQTALQSAKDEEDAFLVDQVIKLFDWSDRSQLGKISLSDIEDRLNDPAVAAEWRSINVQPAEAHYLFSLLDIEETGEISFQEFLSGCLRLHGHSKSMDVLTVMQEARSAARVWHQTFTHWDEIHRAVLQTVEAIEAQVRACISTVACLQTSIDHTVDLTKSNQDKILRVEKRLCAIEGSLYSVRSAASSMTKVNDLIIGSVICQPPGVALPGQPALGSGETIDEV